MACRMNAKQALRCNMRPQLEKGKTTKGADPSGNWLKEKWPALLDAHFTCDIPGPSACLQDALHMIATGKVRITCPGRKKRKKDEQQEEDDEEPRALSELEVQVIKEWYIQREGSEVSGTCSGETDEELFAYIGPEQRRKELQLKKMSTTNSGKFERSSRVARHFPAVPCGKRR